MSASVVALLVAATGAWIAWRGVSSSPAPAGLERARARDMAAVTGVVCLLVLAVVVVTWVPAAAAACDEGDPDCKRFGVSSVWTFALMFGPVVALVAGLWRVGLFDLSAPEHEVTLPRAPETDAAAPLEPERDDAHEDEPATSGAHSSRVTSPEPDPQPRTPTADPDETSAGYVQASESESESDSESESEPEPPVLEPRVAGTSAEDAEAVTALESLIHERPLAVVLSHEESPQVNGVALELARKVGASLYMVGRRDATRSPDFEDDNALTGDVGHEDELALAVAGRALAAVLFVDALGRFSKFTLQMLEQIDAACFTDDVTDVSRRCRVVLPCAPGDDPDSRWPTRADRLRRLLAAVERGSTAPITDRPEPAKTESDTEAHADSASASQAEARDAVAEPDASDHDPTS